MQQARAALELLLEPVRPGPSKDTRPRPSPFQHSVSGCGEDMGSRFISAVHGHRPHGTALETRFLCSISAPAQSQIQALIDLWDQGHHIVLREELIREVDLILMPPSWWLSTPCPRQHGWWVRTVDSITLTRCLRCSGMVQTLFLDPTSRICRLC